MSKWWIGCSGFHYKHWRGIFYPEKLATTKWFDFYANHFKTFELNVTFYRFPRLHVLDSWYKKSPGAFSFSVKAPRAITHYKKFNDSKKLLADFYATIHEGLKEKLGCVLFQIPPIMTYREEKLQQIIDSLNPTFTNVLEFRHASWWVEEVYKELGRNNITFCGLSHPSLPTDVIQNTKTVYFRFHGVRHLYKSKYNAADLQKMADAIKNNPVAKEVFIYFNNDIDGSAFTNAAEMEQYISGR